MGNKGRKTRGASTETAGTKQVKLTTSEGKYTRTS